MQRVPGGSWTIVRCLVAAGLALATVFPATAVAISETERIEAVSDFLLDRAQANYLYIFEQRIKNDRTVQCYFPRVYAYITDYDLRLFLKTREDWRESLGKDLERLLRAAAAKAIALVDLRDVALVATDRYVELLQYLEVEFRGKRLSLSAMQLDWSQEEKDQVNRFYSINTLRDLLLNVDAAARADKECGIADVTREQVKQFTEQARIALSDLKAWRQHIDAQAANLRFDSARLADDCKRDANAQSICAIRDRLGSAAEAHKAALETLRAGGEALYGAIHKYADLPGKLQSYEAQLDAAKTMTRRVQIAINLLRQTAPELHDEIAESLKRHVLFFAEISDADSPEQVKAVLVDYTLPAVSFGVKREKYKGHAMISALLGYGYGKIQNGEGTLGRDNNQGIFAPIGLDLSFGTSWRGSFSLMLAPVDFGYPISLKLNGVNKDLKLSDVVAPSVVLSYGVPDYPLATGIAYQRGRRDPASGDVETRLLLFIGFDMPLFALF